MTDTSTSPAIQKTPKEVTYWLNEFNKCKQTRLPFENQWFLNLAFYNGNQYVVWAPNSMPQSTQRLTTPPAPRYRVRLVVNKIKPMVRTEITKLTKEEPQFYVTPSTSEPSDLAAARIAEGACLYILDKAHFNTARRASTFWLSICGTSFLKTYIVEDAQNEMESNIIIDPVSAFHMFVPDIQEVEIEKQPYVIHARTINKEIVEEMYNVKLGGSTTDTNSGSTATVATSRDDSRFMNALGIRTSALAQNLVFTMEIWVKPCKRYPAGAMLVIADNQVVYVHTPAPEQAPDELGGGMGLENSPGVGNGSPQQLGLPLAPDTGVEQAPMDAMTTMLQALKGNVVPLDPTSPTYGFSESEFPFSHGMYPFAKIDHIPSGMFYGQSTINDLVPIQRVYNTTRSQQVEIQNRVSKPQIGYVKGSVDFAKWTSEPGLGIPVNPGFDKPWIIEPANEPAIFQNEVERSNADFDSIAIQYEITKGRTPPGIEAASAISYLSELNDEKLYHTVASIEDATKVVGYQCLVLAQDYWDQEKVIKVVGINGAQEAVQFMGADIKGNTDIRVESGSMAPRSKTANQAFITSLIELGVIPPEKGLRYLEMSATNQLYQESQADSRQAQGENFKMSETGEVLAPNPWDNDDVHFYEHALYLKSQEFENLDEKKKAAHIQHFLLTQQRIREKEMGYGSGVPGAPDTVGAESGAGSGDGGIPAGVSG